MKGKYMANNYIETALEAGCMRAMRFEELPGPSRHSDAPPTWQQQQHLRGWGFYESTPPQYEQVDIAWHEALSYDRYRTAMMKIHGEKWEERMLAQTESQFTPDNVLSLDEARERRHAAIASGIGRSIAVIEAAYTS